MLLLLVHTRFINRFYLRFLFRTNKMDIAFTSYPDARAIHVINTGNFDQATIVRLHIHSMHFLLVLRQMVSLNETLAANVAFVPFSGMSANVRFQIIALREAALAVRTLVRSFAGVDSHVDNQIVCSMKAFSALRTQVRLLSGVVALVHRQIRCSRKAFSAIATLVGLFTLVTSHMDDQIVVAHKAHAAFGAQERFIFVAGIRMLVS